MSEEKGEVRARPAAWRIAHKYTSEEGLIDSLAVEINGILDLLEEVKAQRDAMRGALQEAHDIAIGVKAGGLHTIRDIARERLGIR